MAMHELKTQPPYATHVPVQKKLLFVKSATEKENDKKDKLQIEYIQSRSDAVSKETNTTDIRSDVVITENDLADNSLHIIYSDSTEQHFISAQLNNRKSKSKAILTQEERTADIVKSFFRKSTIDAAPYIVRKKGKWFWTPFFIIVATYCFNQCKLNVEEYISTNLATKITHQSNGSVDFPAITICPMRWHKKSIFGNQADMAVTLSIHYGNSLSEFNRLLTENKRTCFNQNNWTEEMKNSDRDEMNERLQNGSIWTTNKFTITYQDILLGCNWNRKAIDCSDAVLNHVSDVWQCFTFNPGAGMAQFINDTMMGYGLNLTTYSESQFKSGQGHRGLKLYFNIKQSEYCGNEMLKRGAGLFFQIHGTNRNPSFLINPSTYISPGYDTKVIIEKQVYKRKTEHLGYCKSFVPLYLTPNVSFYILEHCYMQCVSEHILRLCKCYPPNLGGFESLFRKKAKDLGLANDTIKVCIGPIYVCAKEWAHSNMSRNSLNILCPYCKKPCDETKYSIQVTSLLLSRRNLEVPGFSNISLTELHKNYLIVNFLMKSAAVQLIVEEQAFDLEDMFIYIGNNIGLYLGMSFTTMFELVYFILILFVFFWKCHLRRACTLVHE